LIQTARRKRHIVSANRTGGEVSNVNWLDSMTNCRMAFQGDRKMSAPKPVNRIAVVGTGVIGASWTALFLAKGLHVAAADPAPHAEASLKKFVESAWPTLKRMGLAASASLSNLKFTPDLAQAVAGADLVQENGPERIEFKQKLYAQLDELLPPEAIIASSSSGLIMSEIQKGAAAHPERCVIAHPFNPPHLIPLVEIVGGTRTSEETIRRATEFYQSIGKQAVRLYKELPGHVANRLQAAVAREVYYLVADGVLSAEDVDSALSWGPGLRWGVMGNMMLNHLAGGPGGIEHFFEQFAGPMTASWKSLGSPALTPEVQKKLIDSVKAEVGSRTVAELEAERDEILLGLLKLRSRPGETVTARQAAFGVG
jgi:3-hydroxyacyl-CoA dehydrogenase